MQFEHLFRMGMDREPGYLRDHDTTHGLILNLGCGNKRFDDVVNLDYPEWDADSQPIPIADCSCSGVYMFHFLEHVKEPVRVLQEVQRVLIPGGVANIVVPYYNSQMQAHDLDHKHAFCEETWKTLFNCPYYNKNRIDWKFKVNFNLIAGVVERNMALFTQLERI